MHRRTTPPRTSHRSLFALTDSPLPDRSPSPSSDEELLDRVLRHESEESWRAFLARFEPLVLATILRTAHARRAWLTRDDLEELRAGFLAALLANDRRALRAFDPARGCKLSSWIGLLAKRHTIDWLRATGVETWPLAVGPSPRPANAVRDLVPTPEDLTAHKEQLERLREAVGALEGRQRQLYRLHFEQGLDLVEVAGRMGTTLQTVHSCRHKMQLRLTRAVRGRGSPENAAA